MCKNPCPECPWVVKTEHNKKWKGYVDKMQSIGKVEDGLHSCHMKSKTWDKVTDKNVCIGSVRYNKK